MRPYYFIIMKVELYEMRDMTDKNNSGEHLRLLINSKWHQINIFYSNRKALWIKLA